MILRRITEHVKAQNWFAVAIDFVIVVVGVFIGIQVSNLNEARTARAHERALLVNLRDDIGHDIDEVRRRISLLEQTARFGRELMPQLTDNAACANDCWNVVVHAFQASQWFDLRMPRPTFEEMSRLGLPRDKTLKDRLNTYYFLSDGVQITNDIPRYRELVRSLIPPDAQTRLWADCYKIDGRKEILTDDCAPALNPEQSRDVVAALRDHEDIATTLTYRLSAIAVLVEVLQSQIAEGEAVIEMIDEAIGSGPP